MVRACVRARGEAKEPDLTATHASLNGASLRTVGTSLAPALHDPR